MQGGRKKGEARRKGRKGKGRNGGMSGEGRHEGRKTSKENEELLIEQKM